MTPRLKELYFKEIQSKTNCDASIYSTLLNNIFKETDKEIIGEVDGNNIREFSRYSFLVAMLAIGMGVDIRDILNVGVRIALVICSVLLFVITISILAGSHMVFA